MTHHTWIVDAHQHFWSYDPATLDWIGPGMEALMRDWRPADLAPELAAAGVDATIAVQAYGSEDDTRFLMDQAAACDSIVGVIGWVDLTASNAGARIEHWQDTGPLVGLRHQIEDEPGLLDDAAFDAGVTEVQRRGLVYEVLVNTSQLDAAVAFCARHDRYTLVVDHLAKPSIGADAAAFDAWHRAMSELAAMPHVTVKLSGLTTETRLLADGALDIGAIHRHLNAAFELFGPARLLFGSDWPVCRLATTYQDWFSLIRDWVQARGAASAEAILGANAVSLYGLPQQSDEG